ncbi:MAG: hypothetical protein KDD40_06120 [Bdellovibrionales bacterium]|nr:hypothetical protein [Bdellovibrionales bacterium]
MLNILPIFLTLTLAGCTLNKQLEGELDSNSSTPSTPETPDNPTPPPAPLECDNTITNDFGGGDGSAGDPYRICSLEQWNHFSQTSSTWDKFIRLEDDLDFTGVTYPNFNTVGTVGTPFIGTFEGNNKSISNISINAIASNFAIFMYTDQNATFKDLTLQNNSITTTGYIGGLIYTHSANGTLTLQNITNNNLTLNSQSRAGGLVYESTGTLNVDQVTISNLTAPTSDYTGGLIGGLYKASNFSNVTLSNINFYAHSTSELFLGGLVGAGYDGAANATFNFDNIQATGIAITGSNNKTSALLGSFEGFGNSMIINISNSTVTGNMACVQCGALIGYASVQTINISKSSFVGDMPFSDVTVSGGLVGIAYADNFQMDESFAIANITGWTASIGGLIGQLTTNVASSINDCYVQGNLVTTHASDGYPGGLIGNHAGAGTLTINRSYFAGIVTGNHVQKGCIANGGGGGTLVLNNVRFDSTTCTVGAVGSAAYTGATGSITAQLQSGTPIGGWSLTLWNFASGFYPQLVW